MNYGTKYEKLTIINTNYDLIAVGNYNKLFIYGFNNKQNIWEENCKSEIQNFYSFTSLC